MRRLCEVSDVQRHLNTIGRFTNEEIEDEIEYQTKDIYDECGDPLQAIITRVEKDTTSNNIDDFNLYYYLGERRIYEIDRVFVGTATKRELTPVTDFDTGKNVGMLKLTSGTVANQRLDANDDLLIYYIPRIYEEWCALRVAKALLDKIDIITSGKPSKELQVIEDKLMKQEDLLNQRLGVFLSSDYGCYNEVYGQNLKRIRQSIDYNKYLWREDSLTD